MRPDLIERVRALSKDYNDCFNNAQAKLAIWENNFADNKRLIEEIVSEFNEANFFSGMYCDAVESNGMKGFVIWSGKTPYFDSVLHGFQIVISAFINGKIIITLYPFAFEGAEVGSHKELVIDHPDVFLGEKAFDLITDSILELLDTFPYSENFK